MATMNYDNTVRQEKIGSKCTIVAVSTAINNY